MFKVHIKTDNDAFSGDNYYPELARILRKIADDADKCLLKIKYNDINGNPVAEVKEI